MWKKGPYGFNIYDGGIFHHVSVPTVEQQEEWILALISAGARFAEVSGKKKDIFFRE
jgi:hypothetical protein